MIAKTIATDPRSEAQRKLDEAAAAGDWTDFTTEELLTEKGALELIAQAKNPPNLPSLHNQPFRWRAAVYRILRCDFVEGEAVVEVVPHDEELSAEIKRRLETDRFHHLAYCQSFGFACFPEDFAKYQD